MRLCGLVIGEKRLAKARQVGPLVRPAERLVGQHARVVVRQVEADIECLLRVDLGAAFVKALDTRRAPAPEVRGVQDRDFALFLQGQCEEPVRGAEDCIPERNRHLRRFQHEEAGIAAGSPDLAGECRAVGLAPVDHGDHAVTSRR